MALRCWATGAVESCTTGLMTVSSKLVGVGTLEEEEERALTVRYASSGSSGACEAAVSLLCLRRSRRAPVSLSDPNTSVHSSKGRLVVTRMEPRS